jgi:glycosyltransferase involved in cell wall biosynthesis
VSLCCQNLQVRKGVLLNPTPQNRLNLQKPQMKKINFLYTGGVYGRRNVKSVMAALAIVLKEYPNVYLVFVGATLNSNDLSVLSEVDRLHVETHAFTKDLTDFYSAATALLDIDADLDDDVFLSGKITNYLIVNRIIISITGKNSPSTKIFSHVNSILQCEHDPKLIAECMLRAINLSPTMDFTDRDVLIEKFSAKSVVDNLEAVLELDGL